jgi:hypothetical protein
VAVRISLGSKPVRVTVNVAVCPSRAVPPVMSYSVSSSTIWADVVAVKPTPSLRRIVIVSVGSVSRSSVVVTTT